MGRRKNPTSQMDVAEKMRTPLAQRLDALITDAIALKDNLGVSIQAVNQYRLGLARPSLENLCKIADFYGVSTDYLLGISDIPTNKPDIQAACITTGLSEAAIQALAESEHNDEYNFLLTSESFKELVYLLSVYKRHLFAMELDDIRHELAEKEAAAKGNGYIDLRMEWKRNNAERRGIKADLIEIVLKITQEIDSHYAGLKDENGQHQERD